MISFGMLSSLARAFFAFWALILCLTGIISMAISFGRKRYLFAALAFVLLLPVYFMWQIIFDFSLFGGTDEISVVTQTLCGVAWVWWLVVLIGFTSAAVLLLGYNIRYEKNFITPNSIKLYLDQIPCGVCCWRANGRVLFSNICMNRLCVALTGGPLLNGNQFFGIVKDGILTVDGKLWRFSCREIVLGNEQLHELIASDITAEYAKTRALEKDKAELSRVNRELKKYTLGMDDIVRRQEILQAKVNIHDEMNRLMLSTVVAESEDAATQDRIFSLWEQNALLLCMEAEVADQKALTRIEELAEALKIQLTWQESLPVGLSEKQRNLFFSAAQEGIANAAKHAQAKEIYISFEETKNSIRCSFANDGVVPKGKVTFSGGLANLARLAEKQGASVTIDTDKKFTLSLFFPKNNPNG